MDGLTTSLYNRGYIDLSSVSDCFKKVKENDDFISKLLRITGINRRPTPWDRENLKKWRSWNMTDEMIIEAGKLSSNKSSPFAYMHGILSNWKNNGIFSLENINNEKQLLGIPCFEKIIEVNI